MTIPDARAHCRIWQTRQRLPALTVVGAQSLTFTRFNSSITDGPPKGLLFAFRYI
jgi:hypothetical protein